MGRMSSATAVGITAIQRRSIPYNEHGMMWAYLGIQPKSDSILHLLQAKPSQTKEVLKLVTICDTSLPWHCH